MEPECSLPHSQVPATCPSPEPDGYIQHPHPTSWMSILILSSRLYLGLPSGFFPTYFPTKTLYTPLVFPAHSTYPSHLIIYLYIHIYNYVYYELIEIHFTSKFTSTEMNFTTWNFSRFYVVSFHRIRSSNTDDRNHQMRVDECSWWYKFRAVISCNEYWGQGLEQSGCTAQQIDLNQQWLQLI